MASRLDIIDKQLSVGEVKTITYNGGKNIKYMELLFSPTHKTQFAPSEDKKYLNYSIVDNNLELQESHCKIAKRTLYDYIIGLKNMYNELED